MQIFKNLKTSDKISYSFVFFNTISLLLLLFSINIIYFFIWYFEIEKESLYDMNKNYSSYTNMDNSDNKKSFKEYILKKDTIITPNDDSEVICSSSVTSKIHNNEKALEEIMNSFFYKIDGKMYFIFSRNYEDIGKVSILYDTTNYIKSQIIIIKVSSIIILFFIIINFFLGRYISKKLLSNLKKISEKLKGVDMKNINFDINIQAPKDDEIKIMTTALYKAFAKIKSQGKNQKQFITDVAHEFKTPLMSINSKMDLYKKALDFGKDIPKKDMIDYTKKEIKKLNNLLETLFLLSRIEDNVVDIKKENIDLKFLIKNCVDDFKSVFNEKSIELKIDGEKHILGDKILTKILINNILSNAIKFNDNSVKIEVILEKNSLKIMDNGLGIGEKFIDTIWEKFNREDTKIEGFGVGLFLVKRIIHIHNWKIQVKSQEGNGTTFSINF